MTSLTLVRQVRARPSTVFDLLSTAEGLTAWWGPDAFPALSAEADVRVGGRFRARFRTIDGAEHECAGEFLEVEPPVRIAMSWRWTAGGEPEERGAVSRLELHVRATNTGAELMLVHSDLRNPASEASHRQGWAGALDKLQARLGGAP
ncbi:MAG: SRPBCC domain-containing protein [Pseudomonadota bacterium]|nr:SRPBCC domain-containing protein [Pseudomonadota bacterium]